MFALVAVIVAAGLMLRCRHYCLPPITVPARSIARQPRYTQRAPSYRLLGA